MPQTDVVAEAVPVPTGAAAFRPAVATVTATSARRLQVATAAASLTLLEELIPSSSLPLTATTHLARTKDVRLLGKSVASSTCVHGVALLGVGPDP
jgi:hypothetical protein